MANLAFDSSVTLVVKTPNQKVDDLIVDCALEWTVKQLKGHLSRVYPTKPASQHQRLIYSGQLLLDHLILRDVLREHEDGKSHTLHLVCPVKGEMSSAADSPATNGSSVPSSVSLPTQANPSTPVSSQTTPDGLRFRGNNTPSFPQLNMYHQQVANAPYQFPVQGQGYPMPPFVPPPYWMQQMFAQQMAAGRMPQPMMYMSPNYGFPQMPYPWSPGAGNVPSPQGTFTTPPAQQIPQTPPQPPANQAPQQQANENAPVNANGGPLFDDDDDDENANRDWLDKIYTLCRVGILLSIFWFYSSTGRFLLLIVSLVLIYLYQTGILQLFRRNRINLGNNPLRQEIPPPVDVPEQVEQQQEQQQQQQQQQQETEALNRSENDAVNNAADNDSDHASNDTDAVSQQPAVTAPPPEPSATTVAYNFVISFFTSLFPNGPPGQN